MKRASHVGLIVFAILFSQNGAGIGAPPTMSLHDFLGTKSDRHDRRCNPTRKQLQAIRLSRWKERDPRLIPALHELAACCHNHGSDREAAALYRESLTLEEKQYGSTSEDLIQTLSDFSFVLADLRAFDEAQRVYEKWCHILDVHHADGYEYGCLLRRMAGNSVRAGKTAEGEQYLCRALSCFKKSLYPFSADVQYSYEELEKLYEHEGKILEAANLLVAQADNDQLAFEDDSVAGDELLKAAKFFRRANRDDLEDKVANRVLTYRPNLPDKWKNICQQFALLYRNMGDNSRAARFANRASELQPE